MKRLTYFLVGSAGAALLCAWGCSKDSSKHVADTTDAGAAGADNDGHSGQTSGGSSGAAAEDPAPIGGGGADAGAAGQGAEGGAAGAAGAPGAAGAEQSESGAAGTAADEPNAAGAAGAAGEDPACSAIAPDARLTSHLRITADNECEVFVNGASVGMTANWSSAVRIDVSLFLHPGRRNVVAIVATNTSSQNGNDRGIIGELSIDSGSAAKTLLITDHAFRVSQTLDTAWTSLAFDDSSWIAATEIAAVGEPPWGDVIPNSSAKWIWFAPVPTSTSDKPNQETTYARREFYLSLDGTSVSKAPACRPPSGF